MSFRKKLKKQKNLSNKTSKKRNFIFLLRIYLVLLPIVFLIDGCKTNPEKIPPHFSKDIISSDYIFNRLQVRAKKIYNVKSFARTTFIDKEVKQSLRQTLIIQGNSSIRVDTYGMFGQALGVFISAAGKMQFLDPAKGRVYSGVNVKKLLRKLLGTQIDFQEHLRIFVGHIPNFEYLKVKESRLNSDKSKYIFHATDLKNDGEIRLVIDSLTLLPLEMTRFESGEKRYYVQWQDYEKIGSIDWPHLITLKFSERQEILKIKYKDPTLNGNISPDIFQLIAKPSSKNK